MRAFGILAAIIVVLAGAWLWLPGKTAQAPEDVTNVNSMNTMTLSLTSSAFQNNGSIPSKFTCDADNISPALEISGVPEGARTLALIMHDPDAPREGGFTHWVAFNLSPTTNDIPEGVEPQGAAGSNGAGKSGYTGPCPPSGEHRYFFYLYALDINLTLSAGAGKTDVETAMQGHVLAQTELMGKYQRLK